MKKKYKYSIICLLVILLLPVLGYLIIDGKNLYIDMYNFRQLKKAKPILEGISEDAEKFYKLKDFNEKYNIDIEPIKNCYSVSNDNGDYNYIFGFKLESYIYIYIYGVEYYIYPGYDIPYQNACNGLECIDINRDIFERRTSNPCED